MNELPNAGKFVPLTKDELAAGSAMGGTAQDDGECIMPVPADAPPMPVTHPKLGRPATRWRYHNEAGAPLHEVWRFDLPDCGKEIRALSLWSEPSGALRWRWKSVPAPRPLYGIDKLAAKPGAAAIVCEGEKSADAAALVFPDSVAVTSSGGSQASAQAAWAPLAGRRVLIWPDADEPGAKYADTVATALQGQDCEVSIIDAVALASLAPDGGKREPTKKGWDAADAGDEWQDLDALRRAAHELAKEPPLVARRDDEFGKPDEIDLEISRLAKLRTVDYEQVRREAAAKLSIRASILDKLVAERSPRTSPRRARDAHWSSQHQSHGLNLSMAPRLFPN